VASGYTNSAVATAAYTITTQAATPTFSVAGGSYSSAQTVTLSDSTSGATIYYTTNGTTPNHFSSVYSAAIPVSATTTHSGDRGRRQFFPKFARQRHCYTIQPRRRPLPRSVRLPEPTPRRSR
jgi:hypothetical protein